jgi:hypothetical protein
MPGPATDLGIRVVNREIQSARDIGPWARRTRGCGEVVLDVS